MNLITMQDQCYFYRSTLARVVGKAVLPLPSFARLRFSKHCLDPKEEEEH
jgi:hypothetical protein